MGEEKKDSPYKSCFLFSNECAAYKRFKKPIDAMFSIEELTEDVKNHLLSLKIMRNGNEKDWDERKLIENRSKKRIPDEGKICAYHRYTLGVMWKPQKSCKHPNHPYEVGKKAASTRTVPIHVVLSMQSRYNKTFPIGLGLCAKHYKLEVTKEEAQEDVVLEEIQEMGGEDGNSQDRDFEPEEVLVSEEVLDNSVDSGESIVAALDTSPIKFRLKRKLEHVNKNTIQQLVWKYKRTEKALKSKFAESLAPGQEEEFIEMLENCDSDEEDELLSDDIKRNIALYDQSDSMGKLVILSLLDHGKYSKQSIMKHFNCSRYRVDQARKWNSSNDGLRIPEKTTFRRNRLNLQKCEHFLDFVFTSGLLQDVAYGVTKIKYDSGDTQKVAHAILTTKFSHAIMFYRQSCQQLNYEPLSDSTLWKILHSIKPSRKKSLAGLDDVTAAGMNGFSVLEKYVKDMKMKEAEAKLEKGKRYLKTTYQTHCSNPSTTISSHSAKFALSDPDDTSLQSVIDVTDGECTDCYELFHTIEDIQTSCQDGDPDLKYDINMAVRDIINYTKHLMRDAQQKKAKAAAFEKLDENTGFWLKDFCQKILPMKFREGQKEYFGKKGMSLHVDILFLKKADKLVKHVYFTAMYRCEQGAKDVISLADIVLDKFKNDEPQLTALFTKSDNAGCYQGNLSAEACYIVCKRKGIHLVRYDYNEPCCGKDQCDRESAAAKTIIRSYVDAGNDLLTAEEVHKGLHYGYGMKNTQIAVVEMNSGEVVLDGPDIPKINNYHSFEFEKKQMRLWRYYGIGNGKTREYSNLKVEPAAKILVPYSNTDSTVQRKVAQKNPKGREDRQLCSLFFCPEAGCCDSFENNDELEEHILSGLHSVAKEASSMDKVRTSFVGRMKATSELHHSVASSSCESMTESSRSTIMQTFKLQGWALPLRSNFRYSVKQKVLLYQYFITGEESGKKISPEQVHLLLRKDLTPQEYVTSQQIRSLFSRWSTLKRQGKLKKPTALDATEEDEEEDDENIDEDEEEYRNDLDDVVNECLSAIQLRVNEYVAVVFEGEWYPGYITEANENSVSINTLHCTMTGKNRFKWPAKRDEIPYPYDDVLCTIEAPMPSNQRGEYSLTDNDFSEVNSLFSQYLQ